MKARNALTYVFLCVVLLVALASLLLAYPSRPGVSSSALLIDPQCPGGKPPPCATPGPTPKNPSPPRRRNRPAPATSNQSRTDESAAVERTYWESIRVSTDPQDFKSYLEKYPNGQFATLARNRLQQLRAAKSSPSPGPATLGVSNLPRTRTNQAGIEFVLIPAGSFMMGSNGPAIERPMHQITINYEFHMGKYEVTQAQWQRVMGNNPSLYADCPKCPVEQVSWNDAQSFIEKLNQTADGYVYRLPTEAEWEYACRARTTGDYAGTLRELAWYSENSGKKTHAVGGKQPNAWGLADMHGNVWEWCEDWYHQTYYGAPNDGGAVLSGENLTDRTVRGGSWYDLPTYLRSASRASATPDYRGSWIGFRVVAVRAQ